MSQAEPDLFPASYLKRLFAIEIGEKGKVAQFE